MPNEHEATGTGGGGGGGGGGQELPALAPEIMTS